MWISISNVQGIGQCKTWIFANFYVVKKNRMMKNEERMQKMDNSSVFDHSNDENVTWDTWWFNNIHIRSHSACYMLWLAIFVHFHHLNGQNSRIIRFQHYFFIFHHFTKLPIVLKIANMHVLHHLRHLRWQFTFFFIKPFLDPIFHGEHDATL